LPTPNLNENIAQLSSERAITNLNYTRDH
jgi:hypothetical protein